MNINVKTQVALDEYIADYISSRYLVLERAADEYIQAENELIIEATSVSDNFIDLATDGVTDEDIDNMIDSDIDVDMDPEDELIDNYFDDDDLLSSDIDAMLDLDPDVNELDFDDDEYYE